MKPYSVLLVMLVSVSASIGTNSTGCFTDKLAQDVDPVPQDLSHITDFGISLFKEIFDYKLEKNFFFSPYSIWNALTLAYFGSAGQTEIELKKVLALKDKPTTLKLLRALDFLYDVRTNQSEYIFQIANKAYFDKSVRLNQCVKGVLSPELEIVDFEQTTKAARDINSWVARTTKDRIKDLVMEPDLINANMVLANAAYFKGTWLYQFKKSATKKELFYVSREEIAVIDFMKQKGNFRVGKSEELGAHILELPYTGEKMSMVVLLPPFLNGDQGFNAMVGRLNSTTLRNALNDIWRNEVEILIPKFTLEESVGDRLIMGLQNMGLKTLFDRSSANLTEFSTSEHLSVNRAIHKAFVEVSEEGTEAAAATALISFRVARPIGPFKFECNHPFLFLIYDTETSNVLFMGAYKSPKL